MNKKINGKALYSPEGKAGEYATYACNFYVGCSNDCVYCYCKRGILSSAMGKPEATLKKCFKNEDDALEIFTKELTKNLESVQTEGVFFSFSTDPLLENTKDLTYKAMDVCLANNVPVVLLTKRADFELPGSFLSHKDKITIGWTLTGCDDQEPNASPNDERIEAMRYYHLKGFKTYASIEPVINPKKSLDVIRKTIGFCDEYKIGLMSGKREYTKQDIQKFFLNVCKLVSENSDAKMYWKDSVLKSLGIRRRRLNESSYSGAFVIVPDEEPYPVAVSCEELLKYPR